MNQTKTFENQPGIAPAENEVEPFKNMKPLRARSSRRAFTKVDLLIIVATVVLLVTVVWPYFTRPRAIGTYIRCVNNLKQVGLAFRIYASDNKGLYPMTAVTNQGGTMEHTGSADAFRHFQIMSNEVSATKILVCPKDNRVEASSFISLSNQNISYFVGLDATETNPASILSGDRNLTHDGKLISGLFPVTTNTVLGWSSGIHQHAGNIAFGDGSVQQVTSNTLVQAIQDSGGSNRLLMP